MPPLTFENALRLSMPATLLFRLWPEGASGMIEVQSHRPSGSTRTYGLLPTYAYVDIPPANPIGSLCTYRPLSGS